MDAATRYEAYLERKASPPTAARSPKLCFGSRKAVSKKVEITLPVTIAAWAICAKNGDELPQYQIDRSFEIESPAENRLRSFARLQIALSESSSYSKFVQFMNEYSVVYVDNRRLRWVMRCIENGNQFPDIQFLLENDLDDLSSVKIRFLRRSAERYERVFGDRAEKGQYAKLVCCAVDLYPVDAVDRVVSWLEMFPRKLFTRGLCERIHGVLKTLVQLSEVKPMQSEIKDLSLIHI